MRPRPLPSGRGPIERFIPAPAVAPAVGPAIARVVGRFAAAGVDRGVARVASLLVALVVGALSVASCASLSRYQRGGTDVGVASVRAVEWNPGRARIGRIEAVADAGDLVLVLGGDGATVLRAGAVQAVAHAPESPARATTAPQNQPPSSRWRGAANVPAPDGSGHWMLAVDGSGALLRLRGARELEPVGARFGLAADPVQAALSFEGRLAGFILDGQLAIAGAARLTRYPLSNARLVAAGGRRAAALSELSPGTILRVDLSSASAPGGLSNAPGALSNAPGDGDPAPRFSSLRLPGVRAVAIDTRGRLYAATDRSVYGEDERGRLVLRYVATRGSIHGLAASGARAWFGEGSELGIVDGRRVSVSTGAGIDARATIAGSPSGDAWVLAGGGLARYALDESASRDADRREHPERAFDDLVAPVLGRSCARCHLPDGSSGVDLSTSAQWSAARDLIEERVLQKRTMPPPSSKPPLADADREAIRLWLHGR